MSRLRSNSDGVGFALSSPAGELVSVRVTVPPRDLEQLLECLATVSFPVNPQIFHGVPTAVEFPAYDEGLPEVRSALSAYGFDPSCMSAHSMWAAIGAA